MHLEIAKRGFARNTVLLVLANRQMTELLEVVDLLEPDLLGIIELVGIELVGFAWFVWLVSFIRFGLKYFPVDCYALNNQHFLNNRASLNL